MLLYLQGNTKSFHIFHSQIYVNNNKIERIVAFPWQLYLLESGTVLR
jgi:hypothetical protein